MQYRTELCISVKFLVSLAISYQEVCVLGIAGWIFLPVWSAFRQCRIVCISYIFSNFFSVAI